MHALNSPLISRTIAKMLVAKDKTSKVLAYMEQHYPETYLNTIKGNRIKECCNMIRFANYAKGEKKLVRGNFCKYDKMCVACATRRAIRMIQRFIGGIEANNLDRYNRYHIVLTIRHKKSDTLIDLLDKMMHYKKIITQSVRNSKRENHHKTNFFCKFFGFASSIEITHSKKSGRHPHIHLLACTDEDIQIEFSKKLDTLSNRELQKSRYDITKDSFCVAIRKVDVANHQFDRQGIAEVFKYAVKFSTLEIEQLAELIHTQQVRQYRFYATTGVLRGRKQEKAPILSEIIEKDEVSYLQEMTYSDFVFDEKSGIYRLQQDPEKQL